MTVKVQDLCSQKTKGNRQCSSKWTKRSLVTVVKVVTARTAGKEGKKRMVHIVWFSLAVGNFPGLGENDGNIERHVGNDVLMTKSSDLCN